MDYEEIIKRHFLQEEIDGAVVFFKDENHRYRYVSDQLLELMAYYLEREVKRDEVINHLDFEIYPYATAKFFVDYDKQVMQSGHSVKKFEEFKLNNTQTIRAVCVKKPFYHNGELKGIMGKTRYLNAFTIQGETVILSPRELDILVHIVFGLPLKQIAARLDISIGTVATYSNRLKLKLGFHSQSDLIKLVQEHVLAGYIFDYLCLLQEETNKK